MRVYYSRAEVARIVGVQPETLRYWERTFGLKPKKSGNRRMYTRKDLQKVLLIKSLIEEENLNINEVESFLRNREQVRRYTLKVLKKWKRKLKEELDSVSFELNELLKVIEKTLEEET